MEKELTNKEAVEDLKTLKQFFEETSGGAPMCLDYAIKHLQDRSAFWVQKPNGRSCYFICSKCNALSSCINNYCYSCGRKMEF